MKRIRDAFAYHLKTRPLFFSCGVFSVAVLILMQFDPAPALLTKGAVAGLLFFGTLFYASKRKEAFFCVLLPASLALITVFLNCSLPLINASEKDGEYAGIDFSVEKIIYSTSYETEAEIRINSVNGESADYRASFTTTQKLERYRDYSDTALLLSPLSEKTDPYVKRECFSKGFALTAISSTGVATDEGESKSANRIFSKLNAFLSSKIREYISGNEADLCDAILLGNRSSLDPKITGDFGNAGVSHILALSGMHVSVISLVLYHAFKKLRFGKIASYAATSLFLVLYPLLTGMSGSVLRSSLMMLIYFSSFLFSRKKDPPTSLMFAVSLILLFSPFFALDAGLVLSFCSTLGILTLGLPVSSKLNAFLTGLLRKRNGKNISKAISKIISYIACSLIFTFSAIAYSLIPVCVYFGETSVISPLGNLLVAPLAFPLILFLLLFFALLPIGPAAAAAARIASFFAGSMIKITETFSDSPHTVSLEYPFLPYLIAVLSVSLLLMHFFRVEKRLPYFAAIFAFFAVFSLSAAVSDSILARETSFIPLSGAPGGAAVRYDGKLYTVFTGDPYAKDRRLVLSAASYGRKTALEALVFLSPVSDPESEISPYDDRIFVKRVFYPASSVDKALEDYCSYRRIKLYPFEPGSNIELSPALGLITYESEKDRAETFDMITPDLIFKYVRSTKKQDPSVPDVVRKRAVSPDLIYISGFSASLSEFEADTDATVFRETDGNAAEMIRGKTDFAAFTRKDHVEIVPDAG